MSRGRPARRPANRRVRLLVVASALFAGAVLLTGLPVSALLAQHKQLSATSAELEQLQASDHSLSAQSSRLSQPGTVSGLARSDYGMVPPGQKAFVILPPPGASAAAIAGSGHVPLDGPPVTPGSAQSDALLGGGVTGSGPSGHSQSGHHGSAGSATGGSARSSGSFWSRVLHTLEFWR